MNTSHYAQYVKEREGCEFLETSDGFIKFNLRDAECFIQDLFVPKGKRRKGVARDLIKKVINYGKAQNCNIATATIDPRAHGATEALKTGLNCGFRLHSVSGSLIILAKEI